MTVPDQAVRPARLRVADDADVSSWLEALAAGDCSPDEFFDAVVRRKREDADVGWEALAQLDQQYRRRRISRDLYMGLKNRLHMHFVEDQTGSQPRPQLPPAPMVATRETPLVEIPVITTAVETVAAEERAPTSSRGEPRAGDRLRDRYRVVEILRRSSSGTLVEAIDEQKVDLAVARKRVAIHVVEPALSRDREYLHRVERLQSLSHPAIARLFDVEEDEGTLLLVMELLNGPSLQDLLARGVSSSTLAMQALGTVARALAYAHSQGVAHGDVSARNIAMTQAGEFRLQGFELQRAHAADPAADRWNFARLAHQVLTGATWDAEAEKPPRRRPPGVASGQWRATRRTLERQDDADVLAAFAGDPPASSATGWAAAAVVAAILGLGVGGYLYADAKSDASLPAATDYVAAGEAPAAAASRPEAEAAVPAPAPVRPAPAVATVATVAAPPAVRARIDLPVRFASVDSTAPVARVWVRRRDNMTDPVTFKWWTESGSAEVDRDFRRIEPRIETIAAGEPGIELLVPLMPDPDRVETRTFWVKIDETSRGATLGESTLMQVAIVPPDQ